MAVKVNSLGMSVSVVLTYSSEVMVGQVVLMQPQLNSIHTSESTAPYAFRLCKPILQLLPLTKLNGISQDNAGLITQNHPSDGYNTMYTASAFLLYIIYHQSLIYTFIAVGFYFLKALKMFCLSYSIQQQMYFCLFSLVFFSTGGYLLLKLNSPCYNLGVCS